MPWPSVGFLARDWRGRPVARLLVTQRDQGSTCVALRYCRSGDGCIDRLHTTDVEIESNPLNDGRQLAARVIVYLNARRTDECGIDDAASVEDELPLGETDLGLEFVPNQRHEAVEQGGSARTVSNLHIPTLHRG